MATGETGFDDVTFDLISVQYHSLKAGHDYGQYVVTQRRPGRHRVVLRAGDEGRLRPRTSVPPVPGRARRNRQHQPAALIRRVVRVDGRRRSSTAATVPACGPRAGSFQAGHVRRSVGTVRPSRGREPTSIHSGRNCWPRSVVPAGMSLAQEPRPINVRPVSSRTPIGRSCAGTSVATTRRWASSRPGRSNGLPRGRPSCGLWWADPDRRFGEGVGGSTQVHSFVVGLGRLGARTLNRT